MTFVKAARARLAHSVLRLGYEMDWANRTFIYRGLEIFVFSTVSRPSEWPSQAPTKCVKAAKRSKRESKY